MHYILLQLKYFITDNGTLLSYYKLRQNVITNYGRQYELHRYHKLTGYKNYRRKLKETAMAYYTFISFTYFSICSNVYLEYSVPVFDKQNEVNRL